MKILVINHTQISVDFTSVYFWIEIAEISTDKTFAVYHEIIFGTIYAKNLLMLFLNPSHSFGSFRHAENLFAKTRVYFV